MTTTHTALLDSLTATWTSSTKGTDTSVHEIAGDFFFTISEAKALEGMASKTAATVATHRTLVEQAIEDACGVAFVPRYHRETLSIQATSDFLPLRWPKVRTIRSASVDGTAYTGTDLTDIVPFQGQAYNPLGWTAGYHHIIVGYEHGFDFVPERVKRFALRYARRMILEGPVDDRATSMSTPDGTFALITPGFRGAIFDMPEGNVIVDEYGGWNIGVA